MMKCDITVAAYNAAHELGATLNHIFAAIPKKVLNKVVIVDNESTDGTAAVARAYQRRYPRRIKYVKHAGMLGSVRYRQAQECSTEYIIYVDSNVLLCKHWWDKVSPRLNPKIGWLFGHTKTVYPQPYHDFFEWTIQRFGGVGFGDTIVRRDVVLDCPQMNDIHLGEDNYINDKVKERGLEAVFIPEPIADHGRITFSGLKKRHVRAGQSYSICNGMYNAIMKSIRFALGDGINWLRYTREAKLSAMQSLRLGSMLAHLRLLFVLGALRFTSLVRDPD